MLTPCATVKLATACLVGVVGWPVLAVAMYVVVSTHRLDDSLWWTMLGFVSTLFGAQAVLSNYLWRFLDPRS